jgi:hypothetical protein
MAKIDQDLQKLVPHLTCLRHFIGCGSFWTFSMAYVSIKAFQLLAETAGDGLMTITKLGLSHHDNPLPAGVFNSFKGLIKLEMITAPRVLADKADLHPESLSSLRNLSLSGPWDFLDTLTVLR